MSMLLKPAIDKISKVKDSPMARQSAAMFTSNILGLGLGIAVSILNTRLLGPEDYGDLKYLLNLFALGVVLLTGGYSYTGARAIALEAYKDIKGKLVGGLYVINSLITIVYVIFLIISSYVIDNYISSDSDVGPVIRLLAPLLFVFPFHSLLEKILEGENRIYDLSIFRVGSKVFYIATLLSLSVFFSVNLVLALTIHLVSLLAVIVYVFIRKVPDFHNIKSSVFKLKELNREHGFQIYIGALVGNGSEYLGSIIIGAFMSNINVGYYALATTVATPLFMIPQSLGTVFFKKFANSKKIPTYAFIATIFVTLLAYLGFNLIIEYVVLFVYSEDFLPVVKYTRFLSIAILLKGCGFFINRFLHSHGLGKELRNASFLRGIINVPGFYFLVKYYDVYGACFTMILSNFLVLIYLIIKYRRYTKSL
ncbi:MAG: oligosaccharide flippase family protein [Cyclobacteriaceae bacterium]